MSALRGRACLITGASAGIGRAIALELARRGAILVLTARNARELEQTCSQAMALGAQDARAIAADLSRAASLDDLCRTAEASAVDVLVNNAGVFPQGAFASLKLAALDACLAVNLRAPFALSRAVAPAMMAARWGRIVNIGSSSAYMGVKDSALYCTSKHALLGLSRALQVELRDHGIRVYCISPGSVGTAMGQAVSGQDMTTFISPQEVAQTVVFAIEQDGNVVCDEIRLNRMSYK
ncbi:MAG TPA: SDR family oxidoreductase [Rhizomicrobium sp.]